MAFGPEWNKTYAAFSEALLDCGEQLTKQGETMMVRACEKWLKKVDSEWPTTVVRRGKSQMGGDREHPWDTGTLHDSISCRISDNNRTIGIRYMTKRAESGAYQTATEDETGTRDYDHIVGTTFGRLMAGRASRVNVPGTQGQMFIGVPYAQAVNETWQHEGFINDLQVDFISTIEDEFGPKGNTFFRNLIVRPRK